MKDERKPTYEELQEKLDEMTQIRDYWFDRCEEAGGFRSFRVENLVAVY